MSIRKGDTILAGNFTKLKPSWSQAEAITTAQLYAGYTASTDGMIVGNASPAAVASGSDLTAPVYINNVQVAKAYNSLNYNGRTTFIIASIQCPVSAGDTIKCNNNSLSSSELKFIPYI